MVWLSGKPLLKLFAHITSGSPPWSFLCIESTVEDTRTLFKFGVLKNTKLSNESIEVSSNFPIYLTLGVYIFEKPC